MEIRRTFHADGFKENLVYGLMLFFGLFTFVAKMISFLVLIVYGMFLVVLWLTNHYFGRIEISKKGIEGPGSYGPSHRVFIPWEKADVKFDVRGNKTHWILIKDLNSKHKIKVMRNHFSENSLKLLHEMILHHHPHLLKD